MGKESSTRNPMKLSSCVFIFALITAAVAFPKMARTAGNAKSVEAKKMAYINVSQMESFRRSMRK